MLPMFFGVLLIASSCGDDPIDRPTITNSRDYFPLNLGHFVEYQVDSIIFDDAPGGNKRDTISFQLREEIGHYFLRDNGDTVIYVHRFWRENPNQYWIVKDVWMAEVRENEALRTEENLTFRKMTFPLSPGLDWISTSYINPNTEVKVGTESMEPYFQWESAVVNVDASVDVGTFNFPQGQAMVITQVDTDDDVMKRYSRETYVRNIGLVQRVDTILDSRCIQLGEFGPCLGKPWTSHAGKGYILSQVMISHR